MMMKLKILATFTLVVNWLHLRCVKQLRHGNQFIFRSRWSIIRLSLHLVSNQTPWSLHTQSWDHQQPPGKFPPPTNSWLTNLNDFCQQTFSVTCSLSSQIDNKQFHSWGAQQELLTFFILFVKLGFTKEIVISAWMGLDAPADIYSICWKPLREVLGLSWEILLFTYSLNLSDFSSDKEYFFLVTTMKAWGGGKKTLSIVAAPAWPLQWKLKLRFSALLGREFLSKHVALKVAHSGHLNILFFFSFWLALIPLGHASSGELLKFTQNNNKFIY